jgi:acetyl esterase/lipase
MKTQSLLFLVLISSFTAFSQSRLTPSFSNVDYVGNGNTKQMLDIYIPSGVTTPTALIIHIHGGAFMGGSKGTSEQPSFVNLYNNGYICADINYRLSGDSIWPAQLYDCKAAVRFLKTNAALYHIDTCRIGLIGESAGGHLVSITATAGNDPTMEGLHLGSTGVTSRVQAVVDLFGPTDFLQMDGHEGIGCSSANHNAANSPESILLGCALPTCPERVESANPMHYLDPADGRFYVSCGDHDCLVAPYSSFLFDSTLTSLGMPHTYELVAGQGHGGSYWHNTSQDAKYLAFFNANLALGCDINTAVKETAVKIESLSIFPNPTQKSFTVILPEQGNFDILITDVTGRAVISESGKNGSVSLNADNLADGLYMVKASDGNTILLNKLIKRH